MDINTYIRIYVVTMCICVCENVYICKYIYECKECRNILMYVWTNVCECV